MNILICYATSEGQTRKIARFCASQLIAHGHSVEVIAATDAQEIGLSLFDAAILAGSVHAGRIQRELADFAEAHAAGLNTLPTLFLQVSLAAAGEDADERADLDLIAQGFCDGAGWRPGAVHHIAGAFRFTQYDFFKGWAMRWIASQRDHDVAPGMDTEYTDWAALASVLESWHAP
ncbi:flavodoxin domain-containing protein [Aestuariivita sp.]|jgi:menaquinone-dependent protoporphyrinogen oxidase|uniref:flavodoxin domain-containing protein n=1 Tax=Aestuariivita sp. TaxID=1872407 RepID=UPI00216C3C01|nr:flavodoxin domain-containing protein [Aestuariivita sp.]MCE8008879.1 protoporphyrinogen oxidase [Aestuariivita sp.]